MNKKLLISAVRMGIAAAVAAVMTAIASLIFVTPDWWLSPLLAFLRNIGLISQNTLEGLGMIYLFIGIPVIAIALIAALIFGLMLGNKLAGKILNSPPPVSRPRVV